jgi:hypothetical protein
LDRMDRSRLFLIRFLREYLYHLITRGDPISLL